MTENRIGPRPAAGRVLGLAALGIAAPTVLVRMRRDFERSGTLRPSTAAAMWGCYLAAGAAYVDAARSGRPLRGWPRAATLTVGAAGAGLTAAGMTGLGGAGQVTGTAAGPLATNGVYRISRNPQYTGTILATSAGALVTGSPTALALAAAFAGICLWWVPVEELALARRHGAAYAHYAAATPRWLAPTPAGPAELVVATWPRRSRWTAPGDRAHPTRRGRPQS